MKKIRSKSQDITTETYIKNLEQEVRDLRRENKTLRKQLSGVDFIQANTDRIEYLKFKRRDNDEERKESSLKEKWICFDCGRDSLKIQTLNLPNKQKKYYRVCPFCHKRTKMKDYHDKVEGLVLEATK